MDSGRLVDGYLRKRDWRVNENSNAPYSFGALNKRLSEAVSKDYWLNYVYTKEIKDAYERGAMHIHDLGGLTLYCCGYSLRLLLEKGVCGVPNIPVSAPSKHFASIINQLANIATVYQNEIMGAVAFSSIDTYLAPYVYYDNLDYIEVKQNMQNLIYSLNSNSRGGAEPAFTNFTFDLIPPHDLAEQYAFHPKNLLFTSEEPKKYKDFIEQMDMINRAFCEVLLEGDASGKPFAYPIPTYNITDKFEWDNPKYDIIWEMTGKFGYPYFGNFVNSDMDIADVRSMCCRLRLDLRELRKRTGGLFGSDDQTGSIGVVTINLPQIGYLARTKEEFFTRLKYIMDLAKDSLEIKRDFLETQIIETNMLPAFMEYVGTIDNHFSTIGLLGMNEMCINFLGKPITDNLCIEFCQEVLEFMKSVIFDYQTQTQHLFNLEATPAEGTCYRLAAKDAEQFPGIKQQGTYPNVYYTNSCRLPVNASDDIDYIVKHQSMLQPLFTGGTAEHLYIAKPISGEKAKHIVRYVLTNYPLPYLSLSPIIKICPNHNMVRTNDTVCPHCGKKLTQLQRVTGYIRNVDFFNLGKKAEFADRRQLQ